MIGISTGFVCHGQYWLVYQSVLSAVDNKSWYFSQIFSVVDKNWLVYQPVLSVVDKIVGISTGVVGRGQYWVVYFTDVSCLDNIGW